MSTTSTVSPPLSESTTLPPVQQDPSLHEHDGHEGMHFMMLLILFCGLVLVQILVLKWKTFSPRTYFHGSFFGLAIVPLLISISLHFTRFISLWCLFALCNSWVIYRASRRPLHSKTPRLVYQWFSIIYQICYAVGIVGYILFIICVFNLPSLVMEHPEDCFGFAVLCIFYGLYFGVLGRDLVHILSEKMACSIGYFALENEFPKKHLRQSICAICDTQVDVAEITLPCTHMFHELCLKGWTILGKRDICPFCKEKVDYVSVLPLHPWDKAQMLYFHLIDAMRYMVVWNPLVFIAVQLIFRMLGLS